MSNSPTKLTIVFPLYGQHKMLERALTALTNQTFTDFKIICLDDKSPENFEALVKQFSDKLDIKIKYNETNLGAMKNIWRSIKLETNSPFILSHHADDFLKADYLEKAITILEANDNISFAVTGPVWVPEDFPFTYELLGPADVDYFDAALFARNILQFAPYIFGSVIYRRTHLINDWKYEEMDTYCDRYFLGEILRSNQSQGAFIQGNGIFEHDHSLHTSDTRSPKLHEDNAIKLLSFYKELLAAKFSRPEYEKIITNNTLYYYGSFDNRSNLLVFYKKQRLLKLIQIKRIRLLGLYALLTLPFSGRQKRKIIQTGKKILALAKKI